MTTIRVQLEDFDAGREIAAVRAKNPKVGAVASFTGVVRDMNDGAGVVTMTLEHYPGMTEKALEEIVNEAAGRWEVLECTVIHRVGKLEPTDAIREKRRGRIWNCWSDDAVSCRRRGISI